MPSYDDPSREAQNASATSGGREAHQQRALEAGGHPAGQPARADLERGRRRPAGRACRRSRRSSRGVGAAGQPDLGDPGLQRLGLAGQRAQHVEGVDVARALPDRVERRLAVASAACPTPRRSRCRPGTPAPRRPSPGCACRPRTSPAAARSGAAPPRAGRRVVDRGGEPQRQRGRGLRLDGQVGDDVLHQRLVGQQAAERRAVGDVPRRLGQRVAHQRRGAEHAVEPGGGDHLDDGADAAALVAEPLGQGAVELELRGGVGPVAELVLERAPRRSGCGCRPAAPAGRTKQVTPPSAWASTRKTSFIGAEVNHLWPCRVYPPSSAVGRGPVTLARTSEPPCFSVMPIPASAPRFCGGRPHARVVAPWRPAAASTPWRARRRRAAPARRRTSSRSGSRDRARSATRRRSRPRGVRARAGAGVLLLPRRGLQAVADRALHQPVPGRVELDLVDAVAVAVVGRPARGGARWPACPCSRASAVPASAPSGAAGPRATSAEPCRTTASDERGVGGDDVVTDQGGRLVGGCARRSAAACALP